MKRFLPFIALLLLSCGQESQTSSSPAESKYEKFIGTYPNDFLKNPSNWSLISPSMDGLQLKKIEEYFGVITPINKEGVYIIGEGCKSHDCTSKNAIFYVNSVDDYFVLFTYDDATSTLTFYSNKISKLENTKNGYKFDQPMPNQARKWLKERGFNMH